MYVAPPDGYVDIVVAARKAGTTIHAVGASTRTRPKPTDEIRFTATARLRAGVVEAVTGLSAHELVDRAVALDEHVRGAALLRDDIAEAPTEERAERLVRFLDARLDSRLSKRDAIDELGRVIRGMTRLDSDDDATIASLARALGTSERSLRRTILRGVGLPPRTILGLARFRRALELLRHASATGAWVAATAGYVDQAHMIRDFRRRIGDSPASLRRAWLASPPLVRPSVRE